MAGTLLGTVSLATFALFLHLLAPPGAADGNRARIKADQA
jgi:hypothetical protein